MANALLLAPVVALALGLSVGAAVLASRARLRAVGSRSEQLARLGAPKQGELLRERGRQPEPGQFALDGDGLAAKPHRAPTISRLASGSSRAFKALEAAPGAITLPFDMCDELLQQADLGGEPSKARRLVAVCVVVTRPLSDLSEISLSRASHPTRLT
jgi:hypothetical protein